jgi:hypothetical protein
MNVFISYASEQRVTAEEIALALRAEAHEVFFDRSQLPEGDAYDARIRDAVAACDLLVFLVSPEAVSDGRYTLTELEFAEQRWPSPAGHVLPVMVRATRAEAVPAYLRAIVILRPRGNAAAEVAAAIARLSRPWWARVIRRQALPLLAFVMVIGGISIWLGYEHRRTCGTAEDLARQAQLQEGAGDYRAAWDRYAGGLAMCPSSRAVARGQEQLAMDWLDNIRVTEGRETFTDIANKVQPTLAAAAVAADGRRAADALAHLGWADFLRSRDGAAGLYPVRYYERAIQRDPQNPYAHAMWGHYILQRGGSLKEANEHFAQALASPLARTYVRRMQIAALLWVRDPDLENEVIRVVNDMRLHGETFPSAQDETPRWRIWDIYRDRLIDGRDKAGFLAALPRQDHLTTFRWLFPDQDIPDDKRSAYLRMVAQLKWV